MKDVNLPLRRAYYAALSAISFSSTAVPAYYGEAPAELDLAFYIVFSSINHNDISTKSSADTETSIQVKIFTRKDLKNAGDAAGSIANQVYQAVYPVTGNTLNLEPDFQLISTRLVMDREDELVMNAQLKYVDRTLIFSHRIMHR